MHISTRVGWTWCVCRLHEFTWHGADSAVLGRMVVAWHKFTKLAVTPDQFYYTVREVRTTDDTMVSVKLMIFYELKDIIKMVKNWLIYNIIVYVISHQFLLSYLIKMQNAQSLKSNLLRWKPFKNSWTNLASCAEKIPLARMNQISPPSHMKTKSLPRDSKINS